MDKRRRLKGWNYGSPGVFFVTFCPHKKHHLLGEVVDGDVMLSSVGRLCQTELTACCHGPDSFVIMPNHVHILIQQDHPNDANSNVVKTVRAIKAHTTLKAHRLGFQGKLWQPSFHDHIVRDEATYRRIREYIMNNPAQWSLDCLH